MNVKIAILNYNLKQSRKNVISHGFGAHARDECFLKTVSLHISKVSIKSVKLIKLIPWIEKLI